MNFLQRLLVSLVIVPAVLFTWGAIRGTNQPWQREYMHDLVVVLIVVAVMMLIVTKLRERH